MGSGRSSSKRKLSKKKSSKINSEARRRKRSKRTKSKKLRRRDDSVSHSEEDSRSSLSVSTSSEHDHRRARARKRSDVKGSRKRDRKSYSSSVSSEDSYRVKKKRKSKRSGDPVVKKKTKKKKLKRDVSIDPISSNSGGGSEFERPRDRSRGSKDERDSAKARSGTKSNKDRSRSCSPYSMYSDTSGYNNEEKLVGTNSSRRLRSVITVANQPEEEEKGWDKDGHKEEIVYDHDDYPSCRSNDSNECIGKRDLAHHSAKRRVENIIGEEDVDSKVSMDKRRDSGEDRLGQDDRSIPEENKSEFTHTIASSGGDDLESILRQKALENLKKFKGGFQKMDRNPSTDQTSKNDNDVKESSIPKAEIVQKDSPEEDDSRGGVAATQVAARITRPTTGRDFSHRTRNDGNTSVRNYNGTESVTARKRVVSPLDRTALSADPQDQMASKSELGAPAVMQESSGTFSTLKQAPTSRASPSSKLPVAESSVDKNVSETYQSVGPSSDIQGVEVKSTSEERNSKEQKDEAKDGSQYEQKTMSVMRGGEMVQVSYKVYIPKNARSLGRSRQLRR